MSTTPRGTRSFPFAVGIGLTVFGAYLLLLGVPQGWAPLVIGVFLAVTTFMHHRLGI
jgi:uncharacterized membrane protein YphA (DoxX/SURF4 family)